MAKDNLYQYDSTAANNLDVGGISVAEGMLPSGVNNAIRELMSHQKDFVTGAYLAGTNNVALGNTALDSLTSGNHNTAIGNDVLTANTSGSSNTAMGRDALKANVTSNNNTAVGASVLQSSTGANNTGVGAGAFASNTSGATNTAVGMDALGSNTTASYNTAVGYQASYAGTTAQQNNSFGYEALRYTTTGSYNNAFGVQALRFNTTGANNTAMGQEALYNNTTANSNTAVGYQAGYSLTTPSNNTFLGRDAGYSVTTGAANTLIGRNDNGFGAGHYITTGRANTVLGGYDGNQGGLDIRTSSNNIVLSDGDGNPRMFCDSSGMFCIGDDNTQAARLKIRRAGGTPIRVFNSGGTSGFFNQIIFMNNGDTGEVGSIKRVNDSSVQYNTTSDARLKENIADMTGAISRVKALNPKRYSWIAENLDAADQDGFLAHEAQTVVPNAVSGTQNEIDDDGNPVYMQMDYSRVVPVLTAALKEAITKIETLEAKVAALETN